MCLGIPVQIIEITEPLFAIVEWNGVQRKISTMLLEDIKTGDFVLVHAGCAIQKLDQDEATDRLKIIKEIYNKI